MRYYALYMTLGEMMKKLIGMTVLAFSLNAMALNFNMKIEGHQKILLNKTANKYFTQFYVETSGRLDVKVQQTGEEAIEFGQDIPTEITNSNDISIVLQKNKKSVRYIDRSEDIDQIVAAKVSYRLSGKIKKIIIHEESMKGLYSKALIRDGYSALAGMNIQTSELKLESSLTFSGLVCLEEDEGLICTQDTSISIKATDEE